MLSKDYVRNSGTIKEKWEYLKGCSQVRLGSFNLTPPSDLAWTVYTLVKKLEELESVISKMQTGKGNLI